MQIINGINTIELDIDGATTTVGAIRGDAAKRAVLNFTTDQTVLVNGAEANDQTVVRNNDTVEFVRRTGTKG